MNDWIKRGFASYGFVTVGLCVIAESMESNGSARRLNPIWGLVSGLRSIFIWIGIMSVVFWVVLQIFDHIEAKKQQVLAEEFAEKERLRRIEADKIRTEFDEKEKIKIALKKQIESEEMEKRVEAIHLRKLKEKQERSPDEAAKHALDDFI